MSGQTVAAAARNYGSTPPALLEMDFPQRLATIRKDRGITQDTLAERVGVHVSQSAAMKQAPSMSSESSLSRSQ